MTHNTHQNHSHPAPAATPNAPAPTLRIRATPPPADVTGPGVEPAPPLPDLDLGNALMDEGIITAEEIRRNLPKAMGNAGFLKLLLYCPMVSEAELAALLSVRHRVPLLDLDAMEIPNSVIATLSARVAYDLECIPLALVGDVLCVGLADIKNRAVIRKLREELGGRRVKVFPCEPSQLRRYIVKHYVVPSRSVTPPTTQNETDATVELDRKLMQGTADNDAAADSKAALEARPILDASGISSARFAIPHGFSPEMETAETPLALPDQNMDSLDLSEDDLEDYLTAMSELDEDHSGFEFFRAEPVDESEFMLASASGYNIESQWEKIQFSHAPVRAEPVVLGFPGENLFDSSDDDYL